MRPEEKLEKTICDEAEKAGYVVFKGCFPGVRGAPDRLFGKDGETYAIEFKRPATATGKAPVPTKQQQKRIDECIYDFGWHVTSCDNLEDARKFLGLGGHD